MNPCKTPAQQSTSQEGVLSWGQISLTANPVKVYAEAAIAFPVIVAQTFMKAKVERDRETEAKSRNAPLAGAPLIGIRCKTTTANGSRG
ncbi:hypothetical protein BDK51DRAFT_48460 [Blyttiomyces helicus]|uniref:Uncharacterized protein n=1 Tax=Blyttiomyces helicus TaxID=388810 RepID=A0A4P9W2Z4_9FUNG|nr:hypothetical protein BDK51DRAFT_48460 [Blyttiomyces helicus]|eukprot:RKO84980.1 hypothetical protein BDK51DRAFT_48460 [Blyttiomyces helicus]